MPSRQRLVISAAISIVLMSGCALPTHTTSATWSANAITNAITTRSATAQVASGANSYKLTVTASCHADEQLIGGGFDASSVFEYALFLHASYPAHNAWTVNADSISHYTLNVYAYCLRGEPSLETGITSGPDCPAGSAPLSHGKTEHGQVTLCAARHVASISHATTPIALNATTNGYRPQDAKVTCPAGAIALDGGPTVGMTLASRATDGFAGWEVVTGGDGAGEVYASCVIFV